MNKKFLSAILFGALMVTSTGTFVSCSDDYDGDIKHLQDQIEKLATKDDLTTQINTLEAALSVAQTDASEALSKAEDALNQLINSGNSGGSSAAEEAVDAAKLKAELLEALQEELATLKAEVQASNEANFSEMREAVLALTEKVEGAVGNIADMVTSVELVYSNYEQQTSYWTTNIEQVKVELNQGGWFESVEPEWYNYEEVKDDQDNVIGWTYYQVLDRQGYIGQWLNNQTVFEQDAKFGTKTSYIEFKKGDQKQRGAKFVVRVSPTNAVLTKDMISLVNSKGETLDILKVVNVKHYDRLLTRGVEDNGLWEVEVALEKYDKDEFNARVYDNGKSILFAVAVNNTLSTASTRKVISSYDLFLRNTPYYGNSYLAFFVDDTPSYSINNRPYGAQPNESLEEASNADKCYKEMVWDYRTSVPAVSAITEGAKKNVQISGVDGFVVDNRAGEKPYPAVQGVPMTITLSAGDFSDINKSYSPDVKAMYVTLDTQNAVESAPSELNAWNSYDIEGLNTVVEGTSTQITIKNTNGVISDVIGFRVYAVNWDGTLVDPDGKAFYVKVGDVADDWNATATNITAGIAAATDTQSERVAVSLSKLSDVQVQEVEWATDKIKVGDIEYGSPVFDVVFVDKDGNKLYSTADAYNFDNIFKDNAYAFDKVAKVYTVPTLNNWLIYADNKTYNGTLTLKNSDGHVIATLDVSMTKVLPTTMPAGFSLRDKQVINGVYNCYLIADDWTAGNAEYGTMPIVNLINFGNDATNGAYYQVEFEESTKDGNGKLVSEVPAGDEILSIAKGYIDNETEHATTVYYNYGKISTETKDANGNVIDYRITGTTFKTVYCCFYNDDVHTWSWATRTQLGAPYTNTDAEGNYTTALPSTTLVYGQDVNTAYNAFIYGKNAIDGNFSKLLTKVYEESLKVKNAKLVSDATQKEDYFSVSNDLKFTAIKTDLGSNPKANVPSTLIINCKDSYGHDVVIKLAMTVKPQ